MANGGGKIVLASLVFAALGAASLRAQGGHGDLEAPSPELRRIVPLTAAKYKIPGMAVAWIDHGQLGDIVVFGVRDKKSGAPVTKNTVFAAASLGKPVFAYGVLTLAANNRLNLGSPISQYFPLPYLRNANPFEAPTPENTDTIAEPEFNQITAFMVLSHTSGMPNWSPHEHLRVVSRPGSKWSYSGEGYVYLQRAVEYLTGEPLESFAERTVFSPFAMANSSFVWRGGYSPIMATGYNRDGTPSNSMPYTRPVAATTLYTTAEDYAHFLIGILAVTPRDRVHESAVSLMLNPAVVVDSASRFSWGLGWGIESSGGDTYFVHWGASPGYQCVAIASRKTGTGIVILTNSENGLEAAREIVPDMLGSAQPFFKLPVLQPME